ncbi:MAG: magnesium protoporphyrin IX methyltransferase [Hyphomonadaceae bacterium]|nr:magnesium protoporphyrin IX methyltransferase [Hyphomonadaceae bacterium]
MTTQTYVDRRQRLETYFDRTASDAWAQLTSTAPVSRIRATVRAGRDQMRSRLVSWLPADLSDRRVLDAGCGTGALAVIAARRGAHVTAVDIASTLVNLAGERAPPDPSPGVIDFRVGDMLDPAHGVFDHVVSMDSLIHYPRAEIVQALATLAQRTKTSIVFTFAPRTPALTAMHAVGTLFPRTDRAPAIEPVSEASLRDALAAHPDLSQWRVHRTERVMSGFYTSQAMELIRR